MVAGLPADRRKICTPVTRNNLTVVPNIVHLIEDYACSTKARVFYNIFQAFPRSMVPRRWDELLVTDKESLKLNDLDDERSHHRINFLTHASLDRLYVMIFSDGSLVIPSGPDFLSYGPFLEIEDLEAVTTSSQFDTAKHFHHSLGWMKKT